MSVNERLARIEQHLETQAPVIQEISRSLPVIVKQMHDNSNDIVWLKRLSATAFSLSISALGAWFKKHHL